ncbi:MAG: HD domain-containing phosphohydrolase [Pirellulaceae bacterium]
MSSRLDAKHSIEEMLHAMISSLQARDRYTRRHCERVAKLSLDLAVIYELSHEACQEIYLAGIVHDIGKMGIPDSLLLKEAALTDAEYKTVQKHPEIGYRILERLGHLQFVLPGVLYHHERWDGKGYPHGIAGQTIPIMAHHGGGRCLRRDD